MNIELTFAVCFNLGYQYERGGLFSEALSTYSQIVKNKQVGGYLCMKEDN
jgi:intraflagellar transport protein 88